MAKRGVSRNPGYRSGSHWARCWSCDFQFRAEDLQETWDGRWVCDDDFEPRHQQDFLRVKPEKIHVEQPILLDDVTNLQEGGTLGGVTWQAATFGTTSAVAGEGEAGRAIAGQPGPIPTPTFNSQKVQPERVP